MYPEIYPYRAISIDSSVKINMSLVVMRECTTLEAESICVALYCHACCAFCTCCRISLRATALQGRRLQGFNTNHTYHHICVFAVGLVPKQVIQFGRKGQTKEYLWRKRIFSLDAPPLNPLL